VGGAPRRRFIGRAARDHEPGWAYREGGEVDATQGPATDDGKAEAEALEQLATSARGWHGIQLAVLGFIGFCGILWDGGDPTQPRWMQWLPGALVVAALLLALLAIYLVGRVAYPFHGLIPDGSVERRREVATGVTRLRSGIRFTYLAMTLLVTATLSGWVPAAPAADAAVVADVTGASWCGELVETSTGALRLETADGPVTLAAERVALLHPVSGC
jgi:hypothetical protein